MAASVAGRPPCPRLHRGQALVGPGGEVRIQAPSLRSRSVDAADIDRHLMVSMPHWHPWWCGLGWPGTRALCVSGAYFGYCVSAKDRRPSPGSPLPGDRRSREGGRPAQANRADPLWSNAADRGTGTVARPGASAPGAFVFRGPSL